MKLKGDLNKVRELSKENHFPNDSIHFVNIKLISYKVHKIKTVKLFHQIKNNHER